MAVAITCADEINSLLILLSAFDEVDTAIDDDCSMRVVMPVTIASWDETKSPVKLLTAIGEAE